MKITLDDETLYRAFAREIRNADGVWEVSAEALRSWALKNNLQHIFTYLLYEDRLYDLHRFGKSYLLVLKQAKRETI